MPRDINLTYNSKAYFFNLSIFVRNLNLEFWDYTSPFLIGWFIEERTLQEILSHWLQAKTLQRSKGTLFCSEDSFPHHLSRINLALLFQATSLLWLRQFESLLWATSVFSACSVLVASSSGGTKGSFTLPARTAQWQGVDPYCYSQGLAIISWCISYRLMFGTVDIAGNNGFYCSQCIPIGVIYCYNFLMKHPSSSGSPEMGPMCIVITFPAYSIRTWRKGIFYLLHRLTEGYSWCFYWLRITCPTCYVLLEASISGSLLSFFISGKSLAIFWVAL